MPQLGVFSPRDAERVAEATRRVLGRHSTDADFSESPYIGQPTLRVKITGVAVDGIYPAKIMRRDPLALTWHELGDCYAEKVDTI